MAQQGMALPIKTQPVSKLPPACLGSCDHTPYAVDPTVVTSQNLEAPNLEVAELGLAQAEHKAPVCAFCPLPLLLFILHCQYSLGPSSSLILHTTPPRAGRFLVWVNGSCANVFWGPEPSST